MFQKPFVNSMIVTDGTRRTELPNRSKAIHLELKVNHFTPKDEWREIGDRLYYFDVDILEVTPAQYTQMFEKLV
jgi:hypothetical protein